MLLVLMTADDCFIPFASVKVRCMGSKLRHLVPEYKNVSMTKVTGINNP